MKRITSGQSSCNVLFSKEKKDRCEQNIPSLQMFQLANAYLETTKSQVISLSGKHIRRISIYNKITLPEFMQKGFEKICYSFKSFLLFLEYYFKRGQKI